MESSTSNPGSFSKDCYNKANEAFTNEQYDKAVELYGEALAHDPLNVDYLCARAHALMKISQFEKAKLDANKAIDIGLNGDDPDRWKTSLSRSFLRSGVASFNLGRYAEAKNCFLKGQQHQDEMGIKQWITWCDEKMQKLGIKDDPDEVKETQKPKVVSCENEKADLQDEKTKTDTPPSTDNAERSSKQENQAVAMPVPKIKHDWYQTETQVVIEIRIKSLKNEDVKIDIEATTLSVTAQLPISSTANGGNSEYSLELDLAHPVIPSQSSYKVLSTKLEVKLKKQDGIRWANLEGSGETPKVSNIPKEVLNSKLPPAYQSSKGRNWDKIAVDIEQELANDKPEGEAALNEMFQKIYANADENTKRAMNKSFQESGGTVLSTNWNDIGKEKTEVKPPDGMEWKKWD